MDLPRGDGLWSRIFSSVLILFNGYCHLICCTCALLVSSTCEQERLLPFLPGKRARWVQQTVNVRGMNASQVSPPPPFWAEMVPPREVSPHCPPRPPEDVLPRRKVPNLRCAFRQPRAQVAIKPLKRGQCDQGTDPVAPGYRAERRSTCPRTYTPHPTVAEVPSSGTTLSSEITNVWCLTSGGSQPPIRTVFISALKINFRKII